VKLLQSAFHRYRHRTCLVACALTLAHGTVAAVDSTTKVSPALIICSELADSDRTRAVLELDGDVRSFEIVTPEFLWAAPGQPETARFPAGVSDVSPNLAARNDVRLETVHDAEGVLRLIDFGARMPDALEMEGLRGSLAWHETWQNQRAVASLYYTATGREDVVIALTCRRYGGVSAR